MRLLFLSNFYPPYAIGGYEQWCQEVATALVRRGHELRVLTSRHGISRAAQVALAGTEPPVVQRDLHLITDLDYYDPVRFLTRWEAEEAHNRRQLLAAIDDIQPDLIVVWGMWNLSLSLPYLAEQRLPGRVAYYLCSYWPTDLDPHRAYWNMPANSRLGGLLKQSLRKWANNRLQAVGYPPALLFAHAACCSQFVRNALVKGRAVPPETGVLFGGTDLAPFLAAAAERETAVSDTLRLLYFGRLVHDKGVHTILEALGLLKNRIDLARLRLTILGSGHPHYEAYLHQLVEKYGLGGSVTFVGMVQSSEVPQWLGRHDVFLFTSIWAEPMARSVMEAMAAGMFVIGSEVGGQTEMLHNGVNSYTFAAGDAEGLAWQIARLLENPQQRLALATAGQQLVMRDFTLARMVENMESWFYSIAGSARGADEAAASLTAARPARLQQHQIQFTFGR